MLSQDIKDLERRVDDSSISNNTLFIQVETATNALLLLKKDYETLWLNQDTMRNNHKEELIKAEHRQDELYELKSAAETKAFDA